MTDFIETKKVMQPHLPLLIEAAVNISLNTDISFNVREVTIHFLEEIGDTFGKYMVKKQMMTLIQKVVDCGFRIAAESTEEYADDEESPHTLAMYMLYNYASEIPNPIAYPIFKTNIV